MSRSKIKEGDPKSFDVNWINRTETLYTHWTKKKNKKSNSISI